MEQIQVLLSVVIEVVIVLAPEVLGTPLIEQISVLLVFVATRLDALCTTPMNELVVFLPEPAELLIPKCLFSCFSSSILILTLLSSLEVLTVEVLKLQLPLSSLSEVCISKILELNGLSVSCLVFSYSS